MQLMTCSGIEPEPLYLGETAASSHLGKLAPLVFRPLAIERFHFNNYQLWSLIMRTLKKKY